jgi:cysteine synthase A
LGSPTIPQIYIGGKHIGGATDLFAAFSNGTLNDMLSNHGISMKEMPEEFEPLSLLPGWLHKR